MKRIIPYILAFVAVAVCLVSCGKDEPKYDENLLNGYWVTNTTEYWYYAADYTGYTWDTADDVAESEAQKFTWELVVNELRQIHLMEIGGEVPKYYTITKLTSTTLEYKDNFKSYSFTKTTKPQSPSR